MWVAPRAVLLAVFFVLCIAIPSANAASVKASSVMLREINKVRQAHGLASLRGSSSLRRTARGYAGYMLRRDYFGHQGRIRASSRFRRLGEILAIQRGMQLGMRGTVRSWLRSPSHRAVILSSRFSMAGAGTRLGRFRGRQSRTWVIHFGYR